MSDLTVAEAREALRRYGTRGNYCGAGYWVQALLAALDREDAARRAHAERIVSLASLRNVAAGEHVECDDEIPWEAGA